MQAHPNQVLLVIDVQNAIFQLPVPLHEPEQFLSRVCRLVERARRADVPVIFVQHLGKPGSASEAGAPGGELHAAIAPVHGEVIVGKTEPDAFMGSTLAAQLAVFPGRRELVVCGFATQDCVDTTVRSAFARGYSVVLAAGAHTTTANPVLSAAQIIAHHEFVLRRFARVVPSDAVEFVSA
ncbi:MAG: cysteine hydrolase [Myxococcota bacterium]|nr:cysteine hydrolase [Myxococcota bacterium]